MDVAELGNPILRAQAKKVLTFAGDEAESDGLLHVVAQMREVMLEPRRALMPK